MKKPLWMICGTHMFIEIYLLMQVALIPVIVNEFRLSLLEASLVATIPSFVSLLMNIPSGFLADRFRIDHLLFISMMIEGVAALAVSQTTNFWTLVLGVSFLKISSPIYHVSGLSQISRLAKPEQMSRSVGYHNALGSFGSAIGVLTLTFFLSTLGWRWTYLFWAFPALAWGFILLASQQLKFRQDASSNHVGMNGFKRLTLIFSPALLIFLAMIAIREIGATGSSTFMTTYFVEGRNLSSTISSLIFGLGPFIGIVGSLAGGYYGEKLGAKRALSWTMFMCALGLVVLSVVWQVLLIIVVYLFYAFFSNALWSPMNTLVAKITPATDRGLGYSVYFFTEGLLATVAPVAAATVIEWSSIWLILPFSAVFLVASVITLQLLPERKQ